MALPSPFGTFYVPNISPNPNDGIGRWSEADFVTAMTKGTSPSAAHYFPAFPYTSYQRSEDRGRPGSVRVSEDAGAGPGQGARSRHAISVQHSPHVGGWKLLFFDDKPFVARAASNRQSGIAAPIS